MLMLLIIYSWNLFVFVLQNYLLIHQPNNFLNFQQFD